MAFLLFFSRACCPFSPALHLDLLTLFIVFVSLRERFIVAVIFALILGTSLDCDSMGPLGLQVGEYYFWQ